MDRSWVASALIFAHVCCGLAQAPPREAVPRGTGVEIELLEDISSESLKDEQPVPFKLVRALEVNGVTLLAVGTKVSATIASVQRARHWGKAGRFDIRLDPLRLADGTLVRIGFHQPALVSDRGEKTEESVATGIVMAAYFPAIPLLALVDSRKGKPFSVRAGERYLVYVTGTEAPAPTAPPLP